MKKLAIISSYDESCGIATFTKLLNDTIPFYTNYTVEVIPLDLALLQATAHTERKKAEQYIRRMCSGLKDFAAVNIQLESCLYGTLSSDIVSRLTALAKSNPNISVTLHSSHLIARRSPFGIKSSLKKMLGLHFLSGLKQLFRLFSPNVQVRTNRKILKALLSQNCRLIVHTLRTKQQIQSLYNYNNIAVHPLKMFDYAYRDDKKYLPDLKKDLGIADDDIIIGMFGYISKYKGHEDALEAMKFLPDNYKLLIFGRQHPQTIQPNEADAYLQTLLKKIVKADLVNRVYFIGELSDKEFNAIAGEVDVVWLPYYENGQDGSGIASICCDVSKRVLASTSFAFDELFKLIPYKHIVRFDIGNYLEMASKTKWIMQQSPADLAFNPQAQYSTQTQALLYVKELQDKA